MSVGVPQMGSSGSSPRGRGKLAALAVKLAEARLIPAWAGKTSDALALTASDQAHPRVGGENALLPGRYRLQVGSSPRGRGKHEDLSPASLVHGLIPAWAGKTDGPGGRSACDQAHPRVGGENRRTASLMLPPWGSSPRGRGKPDGPRLCPAGAGLIPA